MHRPYERGRPETPRSSLLGLTIPRACLPICSFVSSQSPQAGLTTGRVHPPLSPEESMTCRAPEPPAKPRPEKAKLMSRNASLAQGSLSACTFARRLLEAGRARDALSVLEKEAETGGDSAEVQFLMGRAAFRLCDYDRAHRALCRAVVLSPDEAETYRWLARVLVRRGDAPCAVRVMAQVPRSRAKPASDRAELGPRRRAGAPRQ